MKVAIVLSKFNEIVTERLFEGAKKVFEEEGVEFDVWEVPGAVEIPQIANVIAEKYDGILALGCVIRGETYHFEYVAKAVTEGIVKVSLDRKIPVTFGILTVDNLQQALERAGGKYGNKGEEWAKGLLKMIKLFRKAKSISSKSGK